MKTVLTNEGLEKIKKELIYLTSIERPRLTMELSDTKDRSTPDDNSEYELTKVEYERLQIRISKLKNMLFNMKVISNSDVDISKVSILTIVKVFNLTFDQEMEFSIVPEFEIDIKQNKISVNSPIGRGLLNKIVGDLVEIKTPSGNIELQIMEISK